MSILRTSEAELLDSHCQSSVAFHVSRGAGEYESERTVGHIRFGKMPKTRSWKQVAQLLADDGADATQVAKATIKAASKALDQVPDDPGMIAAFHALTQVTLRARDADYEAALQRIGIDVSGVSDHFELVSRISRHIQDAIEQSGRGSVFSEMARLAAAGVLSKRMAGEMPSLFKGSAEDVRAALRKLSTKKNFASLSQDYFADFLQRGLKYFTSMEIHNHVGPSGDYRFKDVNSVAEFNDALGTFCRQSARIVEQFSGGWYSKTEYEKGIGPEEVRGFLHIAMDKLRRELEGGPG